jgi:hypothetical protein
MKPPSTLANRACSRDAASRRRLACRADEVDDEFDDEFDVVVVVVVVVVDDDDSCRRVNIDYFSRCPSVRDAIKAVRRFVFASIDDRFLMPFFFVCVCASLRSGADSARRPSVAQHLSECD